MYVTEEGKVKPIKNEGKLNRMHPLGYAETLLEDSY